MNYETFRKDYFISRCGDRIVIAQNANAHLTTWEDMEDITKRYLYEVGQKILTPFGIQTIKNIDYLGGQHGYEWLITVEENKNQYNPVELVGIFVKEITLDALTDLLK